MTDALQHSTVLPKGASLPAARAGVSKSNLNLLWETLTDLWEEISEEWKILGLDLHSALHLLCNPGEESPHLCFIHKEWWMTLIAHLKVSESCEVKPVSSPPIPSSARGDPGSSVSTQESWAKAYLRCTVWLKLKNPHHFNTLKMKQKNPCSCRNG